MKNRTATIALIQMSCGKDPSANLSKALAKIAEAAGQGAQIVCLPELFLSPYFCQSKYNPQAYETAEPIPGPTTDALARDARKHRIVVVGGSLFEKAPRGKYYNATPVLGPDGALLGVHRKVHIPEDPLFHEQHYFSPGNTGIQVFKTRHGNIAPLICYDQWFPEAA